WRSCRARAPPRGSPGCPWRGRAHRSWCRTYRRDRESKTGAPYQTPSRCEAAASPTPARGRVSSRRARLCGCVLDEDKREDRPEEHVVGLQEVARPGLTGVVSEESRPPLSSQRRRVPGWTIRSTFRQVGVTAASATKAIRSNRVTRGLPTERRSTVSWCR